MAQTPALKLHSALQEEIRGTTVGSGQVAIWWLGQATFCFKFGRSIVYMDPFYRAEDQEPKSMQQMPLTADEMSGADLICCTHEHLDHIDPLTLPGAAAASPQATVVIPAATREMVSKMNIPAARIHTMRGDDVFEHGGITVSAIPAAHMQLERTDRDGFRYLGYVLQANGVTLYQTGDTQPYAGWYERVNKFKLDVALLPISGVDNLHWQQAVYFCANHRPSLAIPMHYGMFKGYTEDPNIFAKGLSLNVPEQKCKILQVGERFICSANG
jgi:L-ascorbate metabolism protein UlaG (beta-lactamase superfamily)